MSCAIVYVFKVSIENCKICISPNNENTIAEICARIQYVIGIVVFTITSRINTYVKIIVF